MIGCAEQINRDSPYLMQITPAIITRLFKKEGLSLFICVRGHA
jgi:hypothetical protein